MWLWAHQKSKQVCLDSGLNHLIRIEVYLEGDFFGNGVSLWSEMCKYAHVTFKTGKKYAWASLVISSWI